MGTERGNVLLEAHKIINGDRQQSYGNPEDTHGVIAELWNGYMRAKNATIWGADAEPMRLPQLEPKDVALMMVLFKIGRELNGAGCNACTGRYDRVWPTVGTQRVRAYLRSAVQVQ